MSISKRRMSKQNSLFKDDIIRMPEGYYSGDKPNPNLKEFVEVHVKKRPYNPETDNYNIPAFDKPIETTKATAIYNMHTYWSKKPHDAIRQYIKHYTKQGDLVLDHLCGSGGTALAALIEGRKAIAIDISPAATFITKNYCTPVKINQFIDTFEKLEFMLKKEIEWLYETRCDRCGGKAATGYTVYSKIYECPRCLEKVPFFDCIVAEGKTLKGKPKKIKVCPHCDSRGLIEEITTKCKLLGKKPVMVSYICESGCKPARDVRLHNDPNTKKRKYFNQNDLKKLEEIESEKIPYWYPKNNMMNVPDGQEEWGILWRPYLKGITRVDQFFTKRNLWALSIWFNYANQINNNEIRDLLLLTATANLPGLSIMNQYIPGATFPTKVLKGTYYVPPVSQIENVWHRMKSKAKGLCKSLREINKSILSDQLMISTDDARNLSEIRNNAVDYIFTDPPYSWKVQFGEANYLWESWLKFNTDWHADEIIINSSRKKTEDDWARMMRDVLSECYRVLKPGRWLSLCYHDTSEGTWALVQDLIAEAGFVPDERSSALFIDAREKSQKQIVSDKITKRDLVINFRKPKPGEVSASIFIEGDEDDRTFNEKVRVIICEYLESYPGAEKDKIYDEVVSRMVRKGIMEAHNFDEILGQVAEEVKQPVMKDLFTKEDPNLFGAHERKRWYLNENETSAIDAAESAKEDSAAEVVAKFIKAYLKKNPHKDGVHYSDLFEHYVYTVKDKPRRLIGEWLFDYFFVTESGTYRLPASDEEERLKAEGRVKGINRRIKRYVSFLEQGASIPDKLRADDITIAEWIRHCKRSGLYDQGRLLYERGGLNLDNLPEEIMVNVEEDYQVCVRMLERGKS